MITYIPAFCQKAKSYVVLAREERLDQREDMHSKTTKCVACALYGEFVGVLNNVRGRRVLAYAQVRRRGLGKIQRARAKIRLTFGNEVGDVGRNQ